MLCFANTGQMYWLKVHRIPQASRTSAGRSMANVLSLKPEEKIASIIPVREFTPDFNLLIATRKKGWTFYRRDERTIQALVNRLRSEL